MHSAWLRSDGPGPHGGKQAALELGLGCIWRLWPRPSPPKRDALHLQAFDPFRQTPPPLKRVTPGKPPLGAAVSVGAGRGIQSEEG